MNYHVYTLNNYIEYHGRLTHHYNRIGQITSVDKWNDEDTFELTLKKRYDTDDEPKVRAYIGEVRPIYLTDEILRKNYFKFNETTRFFERDGVFIYRAAFIKNTTNVLGQQGLCWDDKGFRVINALINDYSNEEEVLQKTTSVHSINALQNYFEFKLKSPIEINWEKNYHQ